jgi:hypothetical protein
MLQQSLISEVGLIRTAVETGHLLTSRKHNTGQKKRIRITNTSSENVAYSYSLGQQLLVMYNCISKKHDLISAMFANVRYGIFCLLVCYLNTYRLKHTKV